MCCYLIMLLLHKLLTEKQLWVCGAVGAIFHNLGQIGMSILITRTPALISYLPFLLVVGVPAGAFTGLAAQFMLARLKPAAKAAAKGAQTPTEPEGVQEETKTDEGP